MKARQHSANYADAVSYTHLDVYKRQVWDALNPNQYYNNFYGVGNITNPLENMARAKNNRPH